MKRIIMLVAFWAAFMSYESFADDVKKNIDFSSFTSLKSEVSCEITLEESDNYSATVTCDSMFADYLALYVKNNTLLVEFNQKDLSPEAKKIWKSKDARIPQFHIVLRAPKLVDITIAGDTQFKALNEIVSQESFKISISGRAKASGITIKTKNADISVSKNGYADLTVKADAVNAESANGSTLNMNIESEKASLAMGNSAKCCITGSSQKFKLHSNGFSSLNALEAMFAEIAVVMENSSSAVFNTSGPLSVDMKGSSRLSFKGSPDFEIVKVISSTIEPYKEESK